MTPSSEPGRLRDHGGDRRARDAGIEDQHQQTVAAMLTRLIAICTASASYARACPISQPSTT